MDVNSVDRRSYMCRDNDFKFCRESWLRISDAILFCAEICSSRCSVAFEPLETLVGISVGLETLD